MKRLEATYEIREDIADVLARVGSYTDDNDKVRFAGWARMALPMRSFKVSEVRSMDECCGMGSEGSRDHNAVTLISLPFFYDLILLVLSCGMRGIISFSTLSYLLTPPPLSGPETRRWRE